MFGMASLSAAWIRGPTFASIERVAAPKAASLGYLATREGSKWYLMVGFTSSSSTPSQPSRCISAMTWSAHARWYSGEPMSICHRPG